MREAADRLRGLGATVETVTIPMHRLGPAIWLPIAAEGATVQMMHGNGFGFNWQGQYVVSLMDAHAAWRERADELSDTLKNTMLLGQYMTTHHRGRYYAKAQNLVHALKRAYNDALSRYDLLLMPTLPMTATPLPAADAPIPEIIQRAFEILPNTAPFDCTPPPGDEHALRHGGRPAGRHDAGRQSSMMRPRSTVPRPRSSVASTGRPSRADPHTRSPRLQMCLGEHHVDALVAVHQLRDPQIAGQRAQHIGLVA